MKTRTIVGVLLTLGLILLSSNLLVVFWEFAITYDGHKGHATAEILRETRQAAYITLGLFISFQLVAGTIFAILSPRVTALSKIGQYIAVVIIALACSSLIAYFLMHLGHRSGLVALHRMLVSLIARFSASI